MKKLYEFTALVSCAAVIAADTEIEARKAIETWERAWFETGEFTGVSDVELSGVKDADQGSLEDLAHEVV